MATKLTTPESQPDITHQAITQVRFIVPHKLTPAEDDIVFDKAKIVVAYTVTTFDADLNEISKFNEHALWNDLPTVFKAELKAIYDRLVTDAKAKGYIGTGTDEVLS